MFEATVSAEKVNSGYIDFLYDKLKSEIKKTSASVAVSEVDGRVFFSVACEDNVSLKLKSLLTDVLSEIFALGFKNDFLKNNLQLNNDSLLSRTVLNTMTVLDSGADKAIIKRILKDENKIALEGFFEFRLQELKDRWNEVIFLANSNSVMFADESIICDFLSFLIDAIPGTVNYIKIAKYGEGIELFDDKGKQIGVSEILNSHYRSTEEKLLFNVICLSPKKVVVEDDKLFSSEFNQLIKKFFS